MQKIRFSSGESAPLEILFPVGLPRFELSGATWRKLEPSGATYVSGAIWSDLKQPEAIWSNLKLYGSIWSNLKQYEAIWSHVEQSGVIWSHLELSGAIWSNLELFVAIWSHVEQSGDMCHQDWLWLVLAGCGWSWLVWPSAPGKILFWLVLTGSYFGYKIWKILMWLPALRKT